VAGSPGSALLITGGSPNTRSGTPTAAQTAASCPGRARSAVRSTANTGLRRRTAAWTSWKLVLSTSRAAEPHTDTPPIVSDQGTVTRAPDPGATPRQVPSLVTTPPARIIRLVAARRPATSRPGRAGGMLTSSVCSQLSQPMMAASAAPARMASGSWRGSQLPLAANAAVKCSAWSSWWPLAPR
jgi:hypothetical protein